MSPLMQRMPHDTKGASIAEEDGDQSSQCLLVWTLSRVWEDLEEDEAPVQTCEAEYKPGNQLFMTRILLDATAEDLRAASTTSQKLAEGARRSMKARKESFILPDYVREFESVFAKKDFNILPEHR